MPGLVCCGQRERDIVNECVIKERTHCHAINIGIFDSIVIVHKGSRLSMNAKRCRNNYLRSREPPNASDRVNTVPQKM